MEYVNKSGFDGVTTSLSPFVSKEWFTEESAYRGSFVHAALKNYLLGIYTPSYPIEYQGYIESGHRWIDKYIDRVLTVENGDKTRMVDPVHKYSGQPDLLATLKINSDPGVVDWKTGISFAVTWAGQIAGYWNLAKINGYPDCSWGASVRLRKDGRIALHNFIQNIAIELQYFLNANAAYRRYKLKII